MRKSLKTALSAAALMAMLGAATAAQAATALIAHPSNPLAGLTTEEAARIYLGKTRQFPNGKPVAPADQKTGSPVRAHFYKTVAGKSETELKEYWAKLLFTGKAQPPRELADDNEVRDWVSKNPDALGYVDGKAVDRSVKVLLILP